jgi:hypothetical protein
MTISLIHLQAVHTVKEERERAKRETKETKGRKTKLQREAEKTAIKPKAKVKSAPQESCLMGSNVFNGIGIGKKYLSFSGTPIRSTSPVPKRPFAP